MKKHLTALAAAATLIAVAACGGGHGGGPAIPAAPGQTNYNGATSFDWGKQQMDGAQYVGPANVPHMQVSVLVKQQNVNALLQYAQMVSDPNSGLYRQFLTPGELADRFGASKSDYQAAANYFVANGLTVAGWPQRLSLSVAGPQAAMEKAFGTKFGVFRKQGFTFVAPVTTPHFSGAVAVTSVSNLVAMQTMHSYLLLGAPRANSNGTGYSPQQIRTGFDYSGAYAAGFDGTGITVGIVGTGPINTPRNNLCADADLAALKSYYAVSTSGTVCERDVTPSGVSAGLAASGIPTASPVASPPPNSTGSPNPGVPGTSMFPFSGSFQTPPPVSTSTCSGALPACNPEDLEAQLDLQQVSTLAKGANVNFYLAYNSADCNLYYPDPCNTTGSNAGQGYIGIAEGDAEIQQAIADNTADVLSISYGGGEPQQVGFTMDANGVGYNPAEFAELAAEGIAVFVSSGDSGVAECLSGNPNIPYQQIPCVSYPSGDKNVTSVGGVNIPMNEFGQLTGNMTAWGVTNGGLSQGSIGNASGSGGGTSTIFSAPVWQHSAVPSITMREQPDVSLEADTRTGVTVFTNGSCGNCPVGAYGAIGGTSVAAPEMAAMWALVLEACKNSAPCNTGGPAGHAYRLGNAAPYFYSIFKGSDAGGGRAGFSPFQTYVQTFYDVVYGSNAMPGTTGTIPGGIAGPGYDESTGLGVPFARHLIKAVTNQ